MSAEAVGWVYRHSPYTGATFQVHQAVADSVNDQHGNEFWMVKPKLATKARTSVASVKRAIATLCEDRYLELLEESGGRGASRYRFLYPDVSVVYDARTGSPRTGSPQTSTGSPRTGQPGHGEPPTGSPGAEIDPHKEGSQVDPKSTQGEGRRKRRIPEPFEVSQAMGNWALEKWPNVDFAAQTEQFVDYHRGKGSVQRDWEATWRTWIRNAGTRFAPRNGSRAGAPMAKVDQRTVEAMEWAQRRRARDEQRGSPT